MLGTLGTVLKWVILFPVLVAVLLLAVANGEIVTVHLNPFDAADPVLKIDLPLYQIGFILFVLGALVGALVAWTRQRKQRRRARERWRDEKASPPRPAHSGEAEPRPATGYLPRPERG